MVPVKQAIGESLHLFTRGASPGSLIDKPVIETKNLRDRLRNKDVGFHAVGWTEGLGGTGEIFCEDGPPLVISPSSSNFEIAPRIALADETATPHKCCRGTVPGLNVRLKAMESELPECVTHNKTNALLHQALTRKVRKCVVSQERAVKGTSDDIVDIDNSHKPRRNVVNHKKATVVIRGEALEVATECAGRSRRRDPSAMKSATATDRGKERDLVARCWLADGYTSLQFCDE
jgi:hypothetical protein